MPDLAAAYFAGCLVTFLVGSFFGLTQRSRYYAKDYLTLQSNLKKLDQRWNELNLSLEKPSDFEKEQSEEYKKARTSIVIFVGGASALSWLGLLFVAAIWMTL